jgi:hypothetical protein
MNANDFISLLNEQLSSVAKDGRTVLAGHLAGFVHGPRNGSVKVTLINLPFRRHKENRGGGAESMNNRMLFMVDGFSSDPQANADKVIVHQLVCDVNNARPLRKKTAIPEKIASYLAKFINQVVEDFPPNLTHE